MSKFVLVLRINLRGSHDSPELLDLSCVDVNKTCLLMLFKPEQMELQGQGLAHAGVARVNVLG